MSFFFLEFGTSPPVTQYETNYVTAHKGPVTAAAFTNDGRNNPSIFICWSLLLPLPKFSLNSGNNTQNFVAFSKKNEAINTMG